jgi:hypothetical protein
MIDARGLGPRTDRELSHCYVKGDREKGEACSSRMRLTELGEEYLFLQGALWDCSLCGTENSAPTLNSFRTGGESVQAWLVPPLGVWTRGDV